MKNPKIRKTPGFTKEQHLEAGGKLNQIAATLEELTTEVRLGYGRMSRASVAGHEAIEALNKFRASLYSALAEETPLPEWREEKLIDVYLAARNEKRGA